MEGVVLIYIIPILMGLYISSKLTKRSIKELLYSKQNGNYKLFFLTVFICITVVGLATVLWSGILGVEVYTKSGYLHLTFFESVKRAAMLIGVTAFMYLIALIFYKDN